MDRNKSLDIILVLPNQLFEQNDLIAKAPPSAQIILYEADVYFTKYKYHKLRLAFARAAFKNYAEWIEKKYKRKVKYINFNEDFAIATAKSTHFHIHVYDPVDHDVSKWLKSDLIEFFPTSLRKNVKITIHETPMFLCSTPDIKNYKSNIGGSSGSNPIYKQTSFYIWQRKRMQLLLDTAGKPIGGKWSFDKENRLPFPKPVNGADSMQKSNNSRKHKTNPYDTILPANTTKHVIEAIKYVEKWFAGNPGVISGGSLYLPTDHAGAKKQFKRFLAEKLACFGPYQDASRNDVIFGCHTVISPLLNVGLLTPQWVVNELIAHWKSKSAVLRGTAKQKLLESVEALLRQIIGWREIVRLLYVEEYPTMVKSNFFKHTKKLPQEWYADPFKMAENSAKSKLHQITPVYDLLKKVWVVSYANHIERLMYLGGFMLLCEFSPVTIHDWFMCMFIDSYQWVMAANVYAMSQYATPILMTKPYFSSSNYIMKMSGVSAHPTTSPIGSMQPKTAQTKTAQNKPSNDLNWQEIWNSLYYAFIAKHKVYFAKNYATARGVYHWNQKSQSEKNKILKIAKDYLGNY